MCLRQVRNAAAWGSSSRAFLDEARAGPAGLHFLPEFLSDAEAHEWLALIGELALVEARYKD
jgi:hypothetical protein